MDLYYMVTQIPLRIWKRLIVFLCYMNKCLISFFACAIWSELLSDISTLGQILKANFFIKLRYRLYRYFSIDISLSQIEQNCGEMFRNVPLCASSSTKIVNYKILKSAACEENTPVLLWLTVLRFRISVNFPSGTRELGPDTYFLFCQLSEKSDNSV